MGKSLIEIAKQLINSNKKVQLIYAFNGNGKTRLSREFKALVSPKSESDNSDLAGRKPDVEEIITEKDKKEFVNLFGEYLRIENILQNYDEFTNLKALQTVDLNNPLEVEEFKQAHFVSDEDIQRMQEIAIPEERSIQDYRSAYNDIREWLRREKDGREKEKSKIDWDDVVFEVDLLKSQEINLDYILELIYEKNKNLKDKDNLVEEIRRIIRSNTGNRARESLVVDFINQTDLDEIQDKASIIDAFYTFAQEKQKKKLGT